MQAGKHVASGKAQGAEQGQSQADEGFAAGAVVRELRPEQQPQAEKAEAATGEHVGRDALAEEDPCIEGVPQGGGGKHHGDQAAGDPLAGGVEAHEVDAEQAQALGQADAMTASVHRLQAAAEQEDGEQDQPGQGKAVDDRHRNGDHTQLQFQGDPGGAPDQYSQQIQRKVHDRAPWQSPHFQGAVIAPLA
ncbi:hypothetical protein D9M73_174490 [compost metagenome]